MSEKLYRDEIREVVDRTRRIETRLTRYMSENGFDTQSKRPTYDDNTGVVTVPSLSVSLKDLIEAIPQDIKIIAVWHQGKRIAVVTVP